MAKSKAPEVKANKKTEAVPVMATVQTEVKPLEVKKEETKKEEPKKEEMEASAKKAAAKPKKPLKEKTPLVPEVFLQYEDNGEQEALVEDIVAKAKAAYVAEGHRESSIKSLRIYLKPQEWKAYYVINHKIEGMLDLF